MRPGRTLLPSLLAALWALSGCAECEKDFDCPGTKICTGGACEVFVCREDRDCPPAQACRRNACKARGAVDPDEDLDAYLLGPVAPSAPTLDAGLPTELGPPISPGG